MDRDNIVTNRGAGRGTSFVAWIALIVAVLALTLAWMAYDRTGADLDEKIQQQVQQGVNATERGLENTEEAIDAGPDGVDEDDTDTTSQPDATVEEQPTTTQ